MQIYPAYIFYDSPPPRLLTESAMHSWAFSFLSFSGFAHVPGITVVNVREACGRSPRAEGENQTSASTFMAEVRGRKALNKRTLISHRRMQQFAAWIEATPPPPPSFQPALDEPDQLSSAWQPVT